VFTADQQAQIGIWLMPLIGLAIMWAMGKLSVEVKEIRHDNRRFEKRNAVADKDLQEIKGNLRKQMNGSSVHHDDEKEPPTRVE
jgi:hypothetical protein